jgi:hypothetical protein
MERLDNVTRRSACLWVILALVASFNLSAQVKSNVVEVQIVEQGFLGFDGKSIAGADISSVIGAPLVVERFSRPGTFGPSARYWVHGLSGEAIKISAPGYSDLVVGTAGQTFLDVQLHKSGTPPPVTSQRYWDSPMAPSNFAPTAAQLGSDATNVFFASTLNTTGQIVIGRMDRAPTILSDTSPSGASIAAGNKLYLAWAGSGAHPYLNVISSQDGLHFVNKHTSSETSNLRPAIATLANGEIALVWTGTNGQVNVAFSSDDGATWRKQTLPDVSAASPAAYGIGQNLYIAWRNPTSRTITLAAWNGTSWSKLPTAATTANTPSLSMVNGALTLCFSGTDANESVNAIAWNTETMQLEDARTYALRSERTPIVMDYQWPDATNSQPLPLFLYTQGRSNLAARFWSELAAPPFVESTASAYPRYMVATIIYAPPGKSTIQYATQNQLSTSVSLASTFVQGTKVTAGASFNLTGLTGGIGGASGGFSVTAGSSTTTTNQVTDEERLGLTTSATFPGSQSPAIDHDQDLIGIWVNPAVEMNSLTGGGIQWGFKPISNSVLIDYVPVAWLKNPAIAQTNTSAALVFSDLAKHGVTLQDFPKILALDPFAYNPNAQPDPNRFVPTHWSLNYEPATYPGGPSIVSGEQPLTFNSNTVTLSAEQTTSVGMTFDAGVNVGVFKLSLSDTTNMSWTNKVTHTSGDSTQVTTNVSIVGPPYGYSGPIHLTAWYDGFFGSYIFTPDEDPDAEPVVPAVSSALAAPTANVKGTIANATVYERVTLVDRDGIVYTSFTDSHGQFYFLRVPLGAAEVTFGTRHQSIDVKAGLNILNF